MKQHWNLGDKGWSLCKLSNCCCLLLLLAACNGTPSGESSDKSPAVSATIPRPEPTGAATFARSPERLVDYPETGVVLGNGWDTYTARKSPARCVVFSEARDESQDSWINFQRVLDKSSLSKTLDVSAEFKAGNALGGGGSAKAKFSESVKVSSDALSIVVNARVQNGSQYAAPPSKDGSAVDLSPAYVELARRDLRSFTRQCGDSFVSAIVSGAELSGVLTFGSREESERKSIYAEVAASGFGMSGNSSLNKTLESWRQKSELNIVYYQSGGSGSPIATNEKNFLELIETLGTAAKVAPKKWRVSLIRYDSLPSWPKESGSWSVQKYEELVDQIMRIDTLYYQLSEILQKKGEYLVGFNSDLPELEQTQDRLHATLVRLKAQLRACILEGRERECALREADKHLDYEYLITFPIRLSTFKFGKNYLAELQNQKALKAVYDATPSHVFRGCGGSRGFCAQTSVENPAKAAALQNLERSTQVIEGMHATAGDRIGEAVYQQRVVDVADVRCQADVESYGCLSNAEKAKYRSLVEARIQSFAGRSRLISPGEQ